MTTVRLRDIKKEQTREALSSAAMALFERRGVAAVTVEAIADAAGVGKGTLYNYFTGKEEILLDFLKRVESDALQDIARPRTKGRSLPQILNWAAWKLLDCKTSHYEYARHVMARLVSGDAAFLARADGFSDALRRAFSEMFGVLQAAQLVSQEWDPEDLAQRFTVLHLGVSAYWTMEGPPFANARKVVRAQSEIFARGIAA
jgi:AcrR family transcriptional regulator